jgi:uncharacterized protein YqhQ
MMNFMQTCPYLYGFIMFMSGLGVGITAIAFFTVYQDAEEQYAKGFRSGRDAGRMRG